MSIILVTEFLTVNCGCGGVYALPKEFKERCKRERLDWTCPYCKGTWGYGYLKKRDRTEIERLTREKEHLAGRLESEKRAHKHTEYQRRGEKAAKTKLRRRAKGGACPCCNRTFVDLQRHMSSKHPEFGE